jgi:hypothetical protein
MKIHTQLQQPMGQYRPHICILGLCNLKGRESGFWKIFFLQTLFVVHSTALTVATLMSLILRLAPDQLEETDSHPLVGRGRSPAGRVTSLAPWWAKQRSPEFIRTPNVESWHQALDVEAVECFASRVTGVKPHNRLSRTFSTVGIHCTYVEVLCSGITWVSGTLQHHHMGLLSYVRG